MFRTIVCCAVLSASTSAAVGQWTDPHDDWTRRDAPPGQADGPGAWYLAFSTGVIFPSDSESKDLRSLGFSNDIRFDPGYALHLAAGRHLRRFRLEGEMALRSTDIDEAVIEGTPVPSSFFRGEVNIFSMMVNGYYDHPVTEKLDLYLGGGVGGAYVDGNIRGGGTINGVTFSFTDDQDVILVYQFMAGAAFAITNNLALTGGYRLFSGTNPEFDLGEFDMPFIHAAEFGIRLSF